MEVSEYLHVIADRKAERVEWGYFVKFRRNLLLGINIDGRSVFIVVLSC